MIQEFLIADIGHKPLSKSGDLIDSRLPQQTKRKAVLIRGNGCRDWPDCFTCEIKGPDGKPDCDHHFNESRDYKLMNDIKGWKYRE